MLQTATYYGTNGTGTSGVAVGDFNKDGYDDIASANEGSNTVTILYGSSDGSFASSGTALATSSGPVKVVAADFDGDGYTDVATVNSDGTLSVFIATGAEATSRTLRELATGQRRLASSSTSSFDSALTLTVKSGATLAGLVAKDFNGDGHKDLAVSRPSGPSVYVLLGDGSGSFGSATETKLTSLSSVAAFASGDLNGDGSADIVACDQNRNIISVLLRKSDGSYKTSGANSYATQGSTCSAVAIADVNADGSQDVVVANKGSNTVSVFLGSSTGALTSATTYSVSGTGPVDLAIADTDGDDHLDVVTVNQDSESVSVLLG